MIRALAGIWLAVSLVAAPVQSKSSSSHKTSKTATHKSTHSRSSAHRRRRSRPARPSYQLHPEADRYRQIQQALAERGYFKGTADGKWDAASVDALKRFQADQKIDNEGKIDALSLKDLGLGAKHDGVTAATVPLSAASSDTPPAPPSSLPEETPPPQ